MSDRRRRPVKAGVIAILALSLLGCARLEIRKAGSSDVEGLRFYRPWPYLWITVNDKGQCIPSITYLPDTSQDYVIIPHAGFGSVAMKPTLKDGWNLTAFDGSVDTKVAETLNAVGGLLGKIAPGGLVTKADKEGPKPMGPGLYRFVFDSGGGITDVVPVIQVAGEGGTPVACPALTGSVSEKSSEPRK